MTKDILEFTVGFHACETNPFQRMICDTDFTNPYYECKGEDWKIYYSKEQPNHWNEDVYNACKNIDLILEVAKMNFENPNMVATIRDGEIITGNDMDIWKDIKVWAYSNHVYPKKQPVRLPYHKHSYHNRYLRSGINEIKMNTNEIYVPSDGTLRSFEIESSTWQDYYHVCFNVYNRYKFEAYHDGFSGRGHGYAYFDSFEEMQNWFSELYGVRLVKEGVTEYHHYG